MSLLERRARLKVSIVVPCYQEEEALPPFAELLPDLDADEILFVDDGSTDGTPQALRALAAADGRVHILSHPKNRGVGAAMRTGLKAAGGDVVVVYDADRTYPPALIGTLVQVVQDGADIATASPWAEGGEAPGVSGWRVALSRGAARVYAGVLGARGRSVRTLTCAFRAYRRTWIERLDFQSDGFGAAAEILGLALLRGARVVEVPAALTARTEGTSKMRVFRAAREHLGVLGRLGRERSRRMTGG